MKMIKFLFSILPFFILCLFASSPIYADETVYGWQLMTEQERVEHRDMMRSMQTNEERESYRAEHHQKMMERAKNQGMNMPDEPMPRGQGMGSGRGMGYGGGRR